MIRDPLLRKAVFLAKRKKYDESIKILEAEVFRYRESHLYFYILATVCLYAGDIGSATTYYNRAKSIKLRDPYTLLGTAVLFLRSGKTAQAVDCYLDVQDMDGKNAKADKALKIIRKYGGSDSLSEWVNSGALASLYPPLPKAGVSLKPLIKPALIIIAAALVSLGILAVIRQVPVNTRNGMEESLLEKAERENPVELGGSFRYALTAGEVLSCYNEARSLFNAFRDEAAKRELNRILESNASTAVKNKARLLRGYTATPGFDTLKDRFTYSDVAGDPLLYRDCYVKWRGSAANVKVGNDMVSFDFLVGYDTRQVLEGAITVELDFPAEINTHEPLEVLGRVVPLGTDRFMLAGTSIHQRSRE